MAALNETPAVCILCLRGDSGELAAQKDVPYLVRSQAGRSSDLNASLLEAAEPSPRLQGVLSFS